MEAKNFLFRPIIESDSSEQIAEVVATAFRDEAERLKIFEDLVTVSAALPVIEMIRPWGIVAIDLQSNRIVGANFLSTAEDTDIRGVGPLVVLPGYQGKGIGRRLMEEVMKMFTEQNGKYLTLAQNAGNPVSLSLYLSLGFQVQWSMAVFSGKPSKVEEQVTGLAARHMTLEDISDCCQLWKEVCGVCLPGYLKTCAGAQYGQGEQRCIPWVVRDASNKLLGFTTGFEEDKLSVCLSEDVWKKLFFCSTEACTEAEDTPLFFVPMQLYPALTVWCLQQKLKIMKTMNYMVKGNNPPTPKGIYLPSIVY